MSVSTAIGLVSECLWDLLDKKMSLTPKVPVTILAPDEPSGNRRINLFLYKVQENPHLKNMDWQVKPGNPNQLVPPPLSLNLFYLMTAYAPNDDVTGNSEAHQILGDAMRVFHENSIVVPQEYPADDLKRCEWLKDAREQIKIMLNTLDLDELSRVWSTFTQPFRLSVMYEVSVVQLDMQPESERPMAPRVREVRIDDVRAPYRPPVVRRIEPISGAAGTAVTLYGEHLSGWTAYVTLMGQQILEAPDLGEDAFEVTLPADLPPGFHEIQVDISHLFRRTFFFEVTA